MGFVAIAEDIDTIGITIVRLSTTAITIGTYLGTQIETIGLTIVRSSSIAITTIAHLGTGIAEDDGMLTTGIGEVASGDPFY